MALADRRSQSREDPRVRAERVTRQRFARRQWRRRWMSWKYIVAALLLVGLAVASVWALFFSTWLSVKGVEVQGNRILTTQRVLGVAAVPEGEQLALVDLDRARRRLESLAEVRSADVTRSWPDRVHIEVEERTAVAVVELGGRLRALDPEGVVFREYKAVPKGMPRVRPTTATGTDALKEAAGVVAALPADLAKRVDHLAVETIDQITLVLRDGREVLWGSADESELKATVLEALLAEAGEARSFDVSVPAHPTYRP
ncbi:cell division protein FtsQ [Nocardioides gansuensis]|uniref:Cell division protein FtsQ n=1 Tax=Nocardioides gansuensis TaxID=2138300 RepID=A0A2T8FAV2_9ACTN|nr:FtsQ-type POTRA domain-containing protein [Nocardioides gansuensis]PVG82805.1 cell division protein FtsQ [Nocardioides gansuensis]